MSSYKPDDVVYEYVGKDGEHLSTAPAIDITYAMLDMIGPIGLRDLAHSDLYVPVTKGIARLQQDPSDEPPDAKDAPKGGKDN
jgi:hypothetical protein